MLALVAALSACREPLRPLPPQVGLDLPEPLRAVGTEPFWAATLAGGRLTYSTPEDQAGTTITVRRSGEPGAAVFSGTFAGAPLRMRVTPGPCSDGMSDTVYSYTVELTVRAELRRGCARAQVQPTRP